MATNIELSRRIRYAVISELDDRSLLDGLDLDIYEEVEEAVEKLILKELES